VDRQPTDREKTQDDRQVFGGFQLGFSHEPGMKEQQNLGTFNP
jgi:hypothetical protein